MADPAVELQPMAQLGSDATEQGTNGVPVNPKPAELDSQTHTTGADNHAFNDEPIQEQLPPLTFVDFMPLQLETAASSDDVPHYAEFSTVMEQANQWIKVNPDFTVMKCESFTKKMFDQDVLDVDAVIQHESLYGVNKYVRGLRLWLTPKGDAGTPPQEIAYMSVLPDSGEESDNPLSTFVPTRMMSSQRSMPAFSGLRETMEKLNKFLKKKPIPGTVLNVETLMVKYDDTSPTCSLNTEQMSWVESGKATRAHVSAIRVYYITGKPAFETIAFHDEAPVCQNNFELMSRMRFCPFTTVVQRAKNWLQKQQGIKVVNMQTVHVFADRNSSGAAQIYTDKCGYALDAHHEMQLARVLRIFYIQSPKLEACPYSSLKLTSRLFIPTRFSGTGKTYETFSKTMQRVITWLQLTKTPIFGIETVLHPFHPESYGSGVQEDSAVLSLLPNTGKYYVTTVRLYFPCEFAEPPPELLPEVSEEGSWWACSVS